MTTRQLPEVSTASSKVEEIKFLDIVVSQIGHGSYLDSLFTTEFVSWVKGQIQNDFCCDIYSDFEKETRNHNETEKGYQEIIRNRDEDLKDLRAKLETEKARAEQRMRDYEEIRERYYREQSEAGEHIQRLYDERKDLNNKLDGQAEVIQKQSVLIWELKSKLYDFIIQAGGPL